MLLYQSFYYGSMGLKPFHVAMFWVIGLAAAFFLVKYLLRWYSRPRTDSWGEVLYRTTRQKIGFGVLVGFFACMAFGLVGLWLSQLVTVTVVKVNPNMTASAREMFIWDKDAPGISSRNVIVNESSKMLYLWTPVPKSEYMDSVAPKSILRVDQLPDAFVRDADDAPESISVYGRPEIWLTTDSVWGNVSYIEGFGY